MAAKIIERITEKAEKLYQIRQLIEKKEEECKRELESLKTERDVIQELLLISLNKQGLKSIKVSSGDSIYKGTRRGVTIINEFRALEWAKENGAVNIDKVMVAQKLKDATTIPSGFELVQTEFISVRKATK